MLKFSRLLAFNAALALLLTSGIVHGLHANRWGDPTRLDDASRALSQVPMAFGDWTATEDDQTEVESFAQAGAKSYLARRYTNRQNHAAFLVILMCGRPGRMSVHTPEVCYQGAGFEMYDSPRQESLEKDGQNLGTFWTARFVKRTGIPAEINLIWGWNSEDQWEAPTSPRWTYRGKPFLYKLYVSQDLAGLPGPLARQQSEQFMRQFLPQLERVLFPASERVEREF